MTSNLDQWRSRLSSSGLPAFARTVREVQYVTTDRASSATDLSEVIGRDVSMTARLIKVANSPLFNLQNKPFDTINAAVVMIGFDGVSELAVSVGVIDKMLKGKPHARVAKYMVKSFHAAVHARELAVRDGMKKPEEIFVAALFKYVGHMAFWSCDDVPVGSSPDEAPSQDEDPMQQIEQLIAAGQDEGAAEREVLGFELAELSHALAEDWCLGELACQLHGPIHGDDPKVKIIDQGHSVADILETADWQAEENQVIIRQLASQLSMSREAVQKLMEDNQTVAAETAANFGVPQLTIVDAPEAEDLLSTETEQQSAERQIDVNSEQHLTHLGQVARGLEEGWSRDALMQQIVEGLVAGVGCVVGYFCLLSPDRQGLSVKYAAGCGADNLIGCTKTADSDAELWQALEKPRVEVICLGTEQGTDKARSALVAAVHMSQRPIGILVGEIASGQGTNAQLSAFRQLSQQIGLILTNAT